MKKAKRIKDYEQFERCLYNGGYADLCDLYDSDKAIYDKYIEKFRQKHNPNFEIEQILQKMNEQRGEA